MERDGLMNKIPHGAQIALVMVCALATLMCAFWVRSWHLVLALTLACSSLTLFLGMFVVYRTAHRISMGHGDRGYDDDWMVHWICPPYKPRKADDGPEARMEYVTVPENEMFIVMDDIWEP